MILRLAFALYVLSIIALVIVLPSFTSCTNKKRKREDSLGRDDHRTGQVHPEENYRMLSDAICNNRMECVLNLIAAKTEFSADFWDRAHILSVQNGRIEILKELFNGQVSFSPSAKHEAFVEAALNNQVPILQLLINTFPKKFITDLRDQCLVKAAEKGKLEMFEFLTSGGFEFSGKAISSALELAARQKESFNDPMMNLVAHALRNEENGLKLVIAVFQGKRELVSSLLPEASRVSYTAKSFAFFLACCTNNSTIIRLFFQEKPRFHHDSRHRAILLAVHRGYTQTVAFLLENIVFTSEEKGQILFEAVLAGHVEIVQMIASAKGEIVFSKEINREALLLTIERAHTAIAEILINGTFTFPEQVADEALLMAVRLARTEILALLVNSAFTFSPRVMQQALVAAVTLPTSNDSLKAIEILLKSRIDFFYDTRYASIFEAILSGRTETVAYLLSSGLIFRGDDRDEFLIRAVCNSHRNVVAALMAHVPEFSQKIKDEAFIEAVQRGFTEIVVCILNNGVSDEARDGALIKAARHGYMESVAALLKTDVDPETKNATLFAAAECGRLEVVAFLLSNASGLSFGEDVKGQALIKAARRGFTVISIILFHSNASHAHKTLAPTIARQYGYFESCAALKNAYSSMEVQNKALVAAAAYGCVEAVASLMNSFEFGRDVKKEALRSAKFSKQAEIGMLLSDTATCEMPKSGALALASASASVNKAAEADLEDKGSVPIDDDELLLTKLLNDLESDDSEIHLE